MNQEICRTIDAITDREWSPREGFIGNGDLYPEGLDTWSAQILKVLSRIIPSNFMPFMVRQFGGIDVQDMFTQKLGELENN